MCRVRVKPGSVGGARSGGGARDEDEEEEEGGARCLGAPPERAKRAAWSAASRSACHYQPSMAEQIVFFDHIAASIFQI